MSRSHRYAVYDNPTSCYAGARRSEHQKGSGRVVVLVTVAAGLITSAPYRVSHSGLLALR
jgi:hypothetical protein